MIIIVVGLNILIALFGFYVTWRLWRLKLSLGGVADAMVRWEQNARHILNPEVAPATILQGKGSMASLRYQYAHLQLQLSRIRQVLMLLRLLPMASWWSRRLGRSRHPRR